MMTSEGFNHLHTASPKFLHIPGRNDVSGGSSGNSNSSESCSLGISINLSNLNHPILPPSTKTASASFPLRGIYLLNLWVLQHLCHLQLNQRIFWAEFL